MSRIARLAAAALAGGASLLVAAAAQAQSANLHGGEWRRANRPTNPDDEQSFVFEIRFGPYYPQVDEEFSISPGPYERAFDNDPQFYFGLELDWLPLRIPWVGIIGPGFGWGYTATSANAKITGQETESAQETSLTIMPMHLSAVARFDEIMRRTVVPVVPYLKLGLGLGLWSAGTSSETAVQDGVLGRDTTWGIHFALGAMLSLNFLDPRSGSQLNQSVGIGNIYVFGEWMNANLDGIGSRPQMHIGSSSWVLGLAAQL